MVGILENWRTRRRYRQMLGFRPRRLDLYQLALRHRSLSVKGKNGVRLNNERLEFLGDAVLDAVIADLLFRRFDTADEGFLTDTRSKIVQRASLNAIALEMGLDKLLVCADNTFSPRRSIYGNTLEALVGAIYLDRGYRRCRRFLEKRIVNRFVDIEEVAHSETNFKSKLLEWSQACKVPLEMPVDDVSASPSAPPRFECRLSIGGNEVCRATSYSKKSAQQKAARQAWERLRQNPDWEHS